MAASAVEKIDTANLVNSVDGVEKNSRQLTCERCSSKILPPNMGTYENGAEIELHIIKKKKEEEEGQTSDK